MTLPLLYRLTASANLSADSSPFGDIELPAFSSTEFGAFATVYYNPAHGHRPDYAIGFERLRLSNRSMGFLRTALHQHLQIDNLTVKIFSYPDAARGGGPQGPAPAEPLQRVSSTVTEKRIRQYFGIPARSKIAFPDISKATLVSVDGFELDWQNEAQPAFSIQSKRAVFNAEQADEIVLVGRVLLTAPAGSYECGRAVWNTQRRCFTIEGGYLFTANDTQHFGRDICLDYGFHVYDALSDRATPKGESVCLANEE